MSTVLSIEDQRRVLAEARRAVVDALAGRPPGPPPAAGVFARLAGVFVTFHHRGELRGCIGYTEPILPLAQAVIRCAIFAATQDPRFKPVSAAELKLLAYEISVLTPLLKIDDPRLVKVGRDGLVVARGESRGLLLPQVAAENGWDREEFLAQACLKAGLPRDAWKKEAEIYVFEAIVFR
jgi:AmmeMemoRadiSam system protein A